MKSNKEISSAVKINKSIRRSWDINPITRVKENEKHDNKKRRNNEKKEIKRFYTDDFK